jgi:uncharacterized RDD family membrane protein YckC
VSDFPPPSPLVPSTDKVGVGPRIGARLVDALVLVVPIMILTVPISGGFQIGGGNRGRDQNIATCLGVVAAYIYFVACEATRGRTVGKAALGITVERIDGRPLSVAEAAIRNSFMLVSVIPADLGGVVSLLTWIVLAVSIGTDALGRGFHDRWANAVLGRHES